MKIDKKAVRVGIIALALGLGAPGIAVAASTPAQAVVTQPPAPPHSAPSCGPWSDAPNWDFDAPKNPLSDWCTQWQGHQRQSERDGGGGTVFLN
ncbi:hypothetical protein [Rhodococcus jostii]|uniref:Pili structural subunit n=1 Tax=Rhodococcus jostii TaxID=132919 RepID=A0A1H5ICR9_RHOJO|nr:hypothetical protein [Rhodococcus jostii]SEE37986.1 hypothetical protein SAMN04490220_7594 [Rhodococcus jostii]